MIRTSFLSWSLAPAALACLLSVATPSLSAQSDAAKEKILIRASSEWLNNWRRGEYDLTGSDVFLGKGKSKKDFPSVKYSLQPESVLDRAKYNQRYEITWLCEQLAEIDNKNAASALLAVAAAGLDGKAYDLELGAETVRNVGDAALRELDGTAATAYVMGVASGDERSKDPVQAAALRAIGSWKREGVDSALANALNSKSDIVRMAAAEGFGRLQDADALANLGDLIRKEEETNVLLRAMESLVSILDKHGNQVDPDQLRRAATSVVERFNEVDWRVALGAIKFFGRARVREAIPAMIDMLVRFVEDEDALKKGELTGTLRWETVRVLRELTGANFPPEQPNLWVDWWERNGASFKIVEKKEAAEVKTRAGFFGIPVRGNRILFIVDNSGSMAWQTAEPGKDGKKHSGLEVACRELARVVEQLGPDDKFNVVRFSNGPDAWQPRGLVEASDSNKKRFTKWVEGLRADGGTDLWSGLKTGLQLKSLAHGERFNAEVDEVFILSDGAPSVGDIIDPRRIADVLREINGFSKLRINTIFLEVVPPPNWPAPRGENPFDMDAQTLMQTIAEQNDGKFLHIRG